MRSPGRRGRIERRYAANGGDDCFHGQGRRGGFERLRKSSVYGAVCGLKTMAARLTRGATSFSAPPICLPSSAHIGEAGDVAARPRQTRGKPAPTGSATPTNTSGMARVSCCTARAAGVVCAMMTSGLRATSSRASRRVRSASGAHRVSMWMLRPSNQPSSPSPSGKPRRGPAPADRSPQKPSAPRFAASTAAVPVPRETTPPRYSEPRNKLPPSHSITSSARARRVGGIVRPSAFAVFRLITRWN